MKLLRLLLVVCILASTLLVDSVSGKDGAKHKKKKNKQHHRKLSSTEQFLGRLNEAIDLIQTKSDYSNPKPILVKPSYLDDEKGVRAEAKIIGGVLVSKKYVR